VSEGDLISLREWIRMYRVPGEEGGESNWMVGV